MLDLAVLGLYFVVTLGFGLWMGRREGSLEGFALANRSMPWWAVLISIVATETTAATFLGTPGEGFTLRSYTYLQITVGMLLGRSVAAFLFLPTFYRLRVTSIYEYLGTRFGPRTRDASSALFLVTRVLASGSRLYVAAIVLVVLCRAQLLEGALTPGMEFGIYVAAIVLMTTLTAAYTTIGGIKAVIWTDVIQTGLMVGGALTAIALIVLRLPPGAFNPSDYPVIDWGVRAEATLGQNLRLILDGKYTVWTALIGSVFITMATHGTDQDFVQRLLTAREPRRGQWALVLSGVVELPIVFAFLSIGILLSLFYAQYPDPQLPKKSSEIFSHFIVTQLPPGFRGAVIAAVFATAMGSLSAAMNALATSFTRDFYQPYTREAPSEETAVHAARGATLLFAGLLVLVASATAAFVVFNPDARIIPIVLGIFGYTYGALLGVFLLGMVFKSRGSDRGNLIAMGASIALVLVLSGSPGVSYPTWFPLIAFPWRIMLGTLITLGIGLCFKTPAGANALTVG